MRYLPVSTSIWINKRIQKKLFEKLNVPRPDVQGQPRARVTRCTRRWIPLSPRRAAPTSCPVGFLKIKKLKFFWNLNEKTTWRLIKSYRTESSALTSAPWLMSSRTKWILPRLAARMRAVLPFCGSTISKSISRNWKILIFFSAYVKYCSSPHLDRRLAPFCSRESSADRQGYHRWRSWLMFGSKAIPSSRSDAESGNKN